MMNKLFILICVGLAVTLLSCGDQKPPQGESREAKALLQGTWMDGETEDVLFQMKGDTVYYSDSTSMPAYYKVVGDTLYIGNSGYHIEKQTDHILWFKNQNGEKECDFVDITAWRSTAEFVSRFFTKGRMAVVSGRLQSRKYTDKSGNNRTAWEVQADNVYFGDSKRDGASGGSYAEYGSFAPPAASGNSYAAPQGGYSAPQGGYAAPAAPTNDFSMLDSDDSQLPF